VCGAVGPMAYLVEKIGVCRVNGVCVRASVSVSVSLSLSMSLSVSVSVSVSLGCVAQWDQLGIC